MSPSFSSQLLCRSRTKTHTAHTSRCCLATISLFLLLRHERKRFAFRLRRSLGKLFCNFYKQCLYIIRILGRCFQMQNSMLRRVRIRFFKIHLATSFQICLVACQGNDNVGVSASLQFLDPTLGAAKTIRAGNIVNDYGGRRSTIIHGRQTAIALLTRSVPNCSVLNSRKK
jgi:hypothetical protein